MSHHDHLHTAAELIPAEAPESSARRRVIAGWVLGAGLAAIAMAFPQERLIGQQMARAEIGFDSIAGVPFLAFRHFLVWITELEAEAAGFVVAALAYGACLPVCLSIARRAEHNLGLSLATSLVVLLSPVAWLAATTPGPASLGLLVSLLVLREVWSRTRPQVFNVVLIWYVAVWCAPVCVWLLPALAWAVGASRGELRRGRIAALAVLGFGLAGLALLLPLTEGLGREAIFGGSAGWGQIIAWGMGWLPALGVTGLAVAGLFLLRRHESEAPPPRWLLLWCLLPLVAVALGGSPTWEIPYLWLLPPALIGGLDLLARLEERVVGLFSLGSIGVQVAVLGGALVIVSSTDPLADWRKSATETLEVGDQVLTTRADHAYLLRERWGLSALRVDQPGLGVFDSAWWVEFAQEVTARGVRVVFDTDVEEGRWSEFEELVEALEAEVPLIRLEVGR